MMSLQNTGRAKVPLRRATEQCELASGAMMTERWGGNHVRV